MKPDVTAERGYVPPLRFRALTRFYDGVVRLTTREAAWRPRLVEQAGLASGLRILDLGCGTGSLTLRLAQAAPCAEIVGLDADAEALAIAEAKLRAAGVRARLEHALAQEAVFPDGHFDRVVSGLFFHHITPATRVQVLARARAWLAPEGELHVADWGKPGGALSRAAFGLVRVLDGFENTRDQAREGLAPSLVRAGFTRVRETGRVPTVFGILSLYAAARGPALNRSERRDETGAGDLV